MLTAICLLLYFFFFNDTATTEIYTLSLHDALPICIKSLANLLGWLTFLVPTALLLSRVLPPRIAQAKRLTARSEEHTSELQSRQYLVCRLLLEKKKNSELSVHQLRITVYIISLHLR